MAFSRRLLNDDEDIVLDLHPHWWSLIGPIAALIAAVVLGIVVINETDWAPINAAVAVVILGVLGWFGVSYAQWATTHFVVTTDRLIYRTGVLAKRGIEIPLERVNTVFFSQSILERLLRAGDLVIESAGEQGRQSFSNVRNPSAVQNEIYVQMEDNENRKFDRIGTRSEPSPIDIPGQIEQLDGLRRRGVLTEAEFEAKKADLLRRI